MAGHWMGSSTAGRCLESFGGIGARCGTDLLPLPWKTVCWRRCGMKLLTAMPARLHYSLVIDHRLPESLSTITGTGDLRAVDSSICIVPDWASGEK